MEQERLNDIENIQGCDILAKVQEFESLVNENNEIYNEYFGGIDTHSILCEIFDDEQKTGITPNESKIERKLVDRMINKVLTEHENELDCGKFEQLLTKLEIILLEKIYREYEFKKLLNKLDLQKFGEYRDNLHSRLDNILEDPENLEKEYKNLQNLSNLINILQKLEIEHKIQDRK